MLKNTRKLICAAYRSWRERRERGELRRFTREDSRSRLARLVDLCGSLLLIWVLALLLLNILGTGLLAPFAATGLTAAAGATALRLQRRRYRAEPAPGRSCNPSGSGGADHGGSPGTRKESPGVTPRSIPSLAALKRTALRREKARPYFLTGTFLLVCRLILGPQLPASGLYFLLAAANLALGLACLVCAAKETGLPQRPDPKEP